MSEPQKPWWNDGDKVGGLTATLFVLAALAIFWAFVIKLCLLIVTGEWNW